MSHSVSRVLRALIVFLAAGLSGSSVHAQSQPNWLSGGSLHNWYSEMGAEREHGFVSRQQFGLQWPGVGRLRDAQAGKGLWIGARNVTDPDGNTHAYRIAHIGLRHRGTGEVFPVEFVSSARRPLTSVRVGGRQSTGPASPRIDVIDPDQLADHMIVNRVNTLLGVTMERRIMQFAHEDHDNYHVIEYIFTNTGKTGPDDTVTLPDHTVEDLVVFLQWRWAVAAESRYVIGNPTGWGMQTMIDRRGDGQEGDPDDEQFRAQFAWHGHVPWFSHYSPVGGPILPQALPAAQIAADDTLGRLGASQFVGSLTLHADTGPGNPVDDWGQPFTRNHFDTDISLNSEGGFSNHPSALERKYTELMSAGIQFPRHARMVEPSGDPGFISPTGNPAQGTNGGYSAGNGYGPYTLAPGESVRFVIVEAAAGLSLRANRDIGRQYLLAGSNRDATPLSYEVGGQMHSMTKNEWVFTSRDSLFQTFRNAMDAFENGWDIPRPPAPPALLNIDPVPGSIRLSWETHDGDPEPDAWLIFRAAHRVDGDYLLAGRVEGSDREFVDSGLVRERDYFYYVQALDEGTGLRSNRYLAQSYDAARFQRAVLHYWSFNNSDDSTWNDPIPADVGTGVLSHTFPLDLVSSYEGTVRNALDGFEEGGALAISVGSDSGWVYLDVPVEDHGAIEFSYATIRGPSGFARQDVEFSIEGSDFKSFGGSFFSPLDVDFVVRAHVLPDLSDYDTRTLRIRFRPAQPQGGSGYNAFDNIRVSGHPDLPYVSVEEPTERPSTFHLHQNYPNPFNPTTTIRYELAETSPVKLIVFNVLGQEVARLVDSMVPAGTHSVRFSADALPSGVYVYLLETGPNRATKKMILLK